jgi:glutaredoxin
MKKVIKVIVFLLLIFPMAVSAKDINVYLFYGDGCPHCKAEEEFLESYLKDNNDVKLYTYEVWYSTENQTKFKDVQKILNYNASGVPYTIIGDKVVSGYAEGSTDESIKNIIQYFRTINYEDKVGIYLGIVEKDASKENNISSSSISTEYVEDTFNIPLLGTKKAKDVSLVLSAVVIGLVDGFNPCAMWILIFLISMLLGMKNKKRMWTLGITFLATSALVYFLFMISWLNLAEFLNKIVFIRIGISFIAIIFGTVSILRYLNSLGKDTGCEVVDSNNRKKIILKIKKIVKEDSFIIALIGVIMLAVSVNIIELLCSLGLPVMFTEILALNEISDVSKLLYTLVYIFFFLLDDLVIFIIAMKTLEIKAISNKYGKYSHLIGGVLMLIIGILMLFKPEWLMFNF